MQTLPPPEDLEELEMDQRPIRYSLDLEPDDYRRLCDEQYQRRRRGERISMRAIILEALRKHLSSGA